jgi:hypothetical protein
MSAHSTEQTSATASWRYLSGVWKTFWHFARVSSATEYDDGEVWLVIACGAGFGMVDFWTQTGRRKPGVF